MRLSVIINTFNEGGRVAATVADFLKNGADEVVICADGTTDGSCDNFGSRVKVIHNSRAVGCGKAKVMATSIATGDVLMWVDAHQCVTKGDLRLFAEKAFYNQGVYTPVVSNIEYDDQWQWSIVDGSNLHIPNNSGIAPNSIAQYARKAPDQPYMVGVGLCMSRKTYNRVGGWNSFLGRHGSQERGMALRAYMANIPVVIDEAIHVGHEFYGESSKSRNKQSGTFRFNNIVKPSWNVVHAYGAVLGAEFFEHEIFPWLSRRIPNQLTDVSMKQEGLLQDRYYFNRNCKARPDSDIWTLINLITNPEADGGGAALEPSAQKIIAEYARGRSLEFGTGTGRGTAIIANGSKSVITVDHMEVYSRITMPRVTPLHRKINQLTDFYDLDGIEGQFDFILVDGPPGTKARRNAIDLLWPRLASGGTLLIDDTKRDKANVENACNRLNITYTNLPTVRGMVAITKP